jgi:hypothetical protein
MKKPLLIAVVSSLVVTSFFANASPAPGCADLTPPGGWTNLVRPFGDSGFWMGDGLTYQILPSWASYCVSDSTGQWDLIQEYNRTQI